MEQQTGTRITSVRTVAIPVSDQDQAVEFYTGTLGFEKRLDAAFGPGLRWVEVAPPGSATSLALVLPGEGQHVGVDTGIRLTTSDADAGPRAPARPRCRHRSRGDADGAAAYRRCSRFRDPDGNALYVVEEP